MCEATVKAKRHEMKLKIKKIDMWWNVQCQVQNAILLESQNAGIELATLKKSFMDFFYMIGSADIMESVVLNCQKVVEIKADACRLALLMGSDEGYKQTLNLERDEAMKAMSKAIAGMKLGLSSGSCSETSSCTNLEKRLKLTVVSFWRALIIEPGRRWVKCSSKCVANTLCSSLSGCNCEFSSQELTVSSGSQQQSKTCNTYMQST
jgi:hypothetical protein